MANAKIITTINDNINTLTSLELATNSSSSLFLKISFNNALKQITIDKKKTNDKN